MNSAEIREMQLSDRDRDKVQEGNLKLAHSTEPKASRGEKTEAESKCFHRKASSTPARLIVAFQHSFIFNFKKKKEKAESSGLLIENCGRKNSNGKRFRAEISLLY